MDSLVATLLFYIFALMTVGSGVMVISSRNPVHSVFFLILAFFNSAALFILLGAEFIAMSLVIVYVGAVAVLFLFVVMMLDINFAELRSGFLRYLPVGVTVAAIVFIELITVCYFSLEKPDGLAVAQHAIPATTEATNIHALGNILYTDYFYPFQMAGIILLIAMIGAIVLTLRFRPGVRRQKVAQQLGRKRADSIAIVKVESGKGLS
jgi:NADH-quinone oxidoreductase subunit J